MVTFNCSNRDNVVEACGGNNNSDNTTSSAFPPETENPRKYSKVHRIYDEWKGSNHGKNPIIDFRKITPADVPQLSDLHRELFPINYDDQFYQGISSGLTQGWVAVWKFNHCCSGNAACESNLGDQATLVENYGDNSANSDELVIGFITTSQDSRIIKDNDYKHVLKNIPESFLLESLKEDIANDSLEICASSQFGESVYKHLVYILTMGVVEEFRFLGVAKQLLHIVISYYQKFSPLVNAIFLHVVEYNGNAINLYKKLKFTQTLYWSNFYKIHGEFYGAFLFAYFYDRSDSSNIFDRIVLNCPSRIQKKSKHSIFGYVSTLISNSSSYFRRTNINCNGSNAKSDTHNVQL